MAVGVFVGVDVADGATVGASVGAVVGACVGASAVCDGATTACPHALSSNVALINIALRVVFRNMRSAYQMRSAKCIYAIVTVVYFVARRSDADIAFLWLIFCGLR